MSFETTAVLVAWIAIVLLSLVVAGLIRHVHALGLGARDPAPPLIRLRVGAPAPGFDRLAPIPTEPVLLLFLSTECPSCAAVLAEVRRLAGRSPVAIRALFAGPPVVGAETSGVPVYSGEADLFTTYGIPATPFAVLIDPAGRIRQAVPVGSARAVRDLILGGTEVSRTAAGPRDPSTAPAPAGTPGSGNTPSSGDRTVFGDTSNSGEALPAGRLPSPAAPLASSAPHTPGGTRTAGGVPAPGQAPAPGETSTTGSAW
jgi:hypothetical protein